MTNYEEIKQGLADYEAKVAKANAKFPERKEFKEKHVYTPLDVEGFDYCSKSGFPGQYPFTRGVQPTMYRGRLWTMRAYAGLLQPRKPMPVINICWKQVKPACR